MKALKILSTGLLLGSVLAMTTTAFAAKSERTTGRGTGPVV